MSCLTSTSQLLRARYLQGIHWVLPRAAGWLPDKMRLREALLHERSSAGGAVWPALLVSAGATLQG